MAESGTTPLPDESHEAIDARGAKREEDIAALGQEMRAFMKAATGLAATNEAKNREIIALMATNKAQAKEIEELKERVQEFESEASKTDERLDELRNDRDDWRHAAERRKKRLRKALKCHLTLAGLADKYLKRK